MVPILLKHLNDKNNLKKTWDGKHRMKIYALLFLYPHLYLEMLPEAISTAGDSINLFDKVHGVTLINTSNVYDFYVINNK